MRRSGLRGQKQVREFLKSRPDAITRKVAGEIETGAEDILLDMRGLVPKDTGDLAAALDFKVARSGLKARIGLLTKTALADHFYWLFLEKGTKGYPPHNIPPLAATPFVDPAFQLNAPIIADRIRRATGGALGSQGGLKGKRK